MKGFNVSYLSNPEIFKENRLPAHSDHVAYGSEYQMMKGQNRLRMSLNGIWKFHYASTLESAPEFFEADDYDCRNWDDIRVPAHIQMEGYDKPHYTNMTYPWEEREDILPGQIPVKFNPVASYVKYFTVPEDMKGERLVLRLNGVESGYALWLNGEYVGYSEDSFDPAEFELTPYVREGENKLAIRVWKWVAGSWCEDQDFFRFSGIFRDIELIAIPKMHVWDVSAIAKPDEVLGTGNLDIELETEGSGSVEFSLFDTGVITDLDLVNVCDEKEPIVCGTLEIREPSRGSVSGQLRINNPHLWSAETPYLYRLILRVYDADGQLTEVISQYVGFRVFEMKNGIMCLNGKRIVFKGVNRHEFSDIRGRVPNRDELIKDLTTMKRHNINAIRTCHYPDDHMLYEYADIFGLYLIAENNMETHGTLGWYWDGRKPTKEILPDDHAEWRELLLDRVRTLYETEKNHPSILIWSCGNESYGGSVIYDMSQLFRSLDKNRLVHYEGVVHDRRYPDTSDMESQMYTPVAGVKSFLAEHPEKPFIMCEYTHAMGNSCGGMHKYTDLSDEEPRYQGGFIWDYIDQSIIKKDRYGEPFEAYGGDFDDRPTDGDFSGDGVVYAGGRLPSPKMQEVKFNYSNISVEFEGDSFTVKNKNLFTGTGDYAVFAEVYENGVKRVEIPVDGIKVAPLSKKTFALPKAVVSYISADGRGARNEGFAESEYTVNISFRLKKDALWAEAGYEVAFGQDVRKITPARHVSAEKVTVVSGRSNIIVSGSTFRAIFSPGAGGLMSYVYAGKEMLKNIPRPNFWRAPVSNDNGNMMQQRYGQWKLASLYLTQRFAPDKRDLRMTMKENDDGTVTFTYHFFLATTPDAYVDVAYTVYGDGYIEVKMSYDPVQGLPDMPEFGMMFRLDADYDHLRWYGLGEAETYADRQRGAKLGIYENMVADNMAKYLTPQECGNKCGVRYAEVTDLKGRGLRFTGDAMSFSALPYTPHEIENAAHAYELPRVHYTIVRAALAQMGVAGDDSWWARVHPEYLIDVSHPLEFTFGFQGI